MAIDLLRGLVDETEEIIDKAMQCSKEIFQDYLYDQNHEIKHMTILEKMVLIDSRFTNNFCIDKSNKITGYLRMTSVMRSNLYSFGSFISVNFMKRKTNVHSSPCIGPVVMNKLKKTSVVCKLFMLEECPLVCYFMLKSIFLNGSCFSKR